MPERDYPHSVIHDGKEVARVAMHEAVEEAGKSAVFNAMSEFVATLEARMAADPVLRHRVAVYMACHTPHQGGSKLLSSTLGVPRPAEHYYDRLLFTPVEQGSEVGSTLRQGELWAYFSSTQ